MGRGRAIYAIEVIRNDYIQYLLSVEVLTQVNTAKNSPLDTLLFLGIQQPEFLFITTNQAYGSPNKLFAGPPPREANRPEPGGHTGVDAVPTRNQSEEQAG